jgi:hypothetical protein
MLPCNKFCYVLLLQSVAVQATAHEQHADTVSDTPMTDHLVACLQALEVQRKVYEQEPHKHVANSLSNVGACLYKPK